MDCDVFVLLLGCTPLSYALASAFSGDYGIPVTVMDEVIPSAFQASAYVKETRCAPGSTSYRGLFLRAVTDFYEAHAGKSLILLPTTYAYEQMVFAEREHLESMFLLPQKAEYPSEPLSFSPRALMLTYCGRTGNLRSVYGKVVAKDEKGMPLAVVTEAPPENLSPFQMEEAGFSMLAVDENGRCTPFFSEDTLTAFCALASAQDTSLAEWMLNDHVLCLPFEEEQKGSAHAIFSLFPYRKIKKQVLPSERERVSYFKKRGLFCALFSLKHEAKSPRRIWHLERFYRQIRQMGAKAKK